MYPPETCRSEQDPGARPAVLEFQQFLLYKGQSPSTLGVQTAPFRGKTKSLGYKTYPFENSPNTTTPTSTNRVRTFYKMLHIPAHLYKHRS